MSSTGVWITLGGMLISGLVWSLHCIGMCGPILIGFQQVFSRLSLTVEGRTLAPRRGRLAWDFFWYHAGRLWTYALLGVLAGLVGQGLRQSSALAGWQRGGGIVISLAVILAGLILLGVLPGLKLESIIGSCALERWRSWRWFEALLRGHGATPRLLLGVVMGFLPCGLVYAMMLVAAALPTPWHAALGMIAFGLGTLPSLTAVLLVGRLTPIKWRAHGTRLAAMLVLLTGVWMMGRTLWVHDHSAHDHGPPAAATDDPAPPDEHHHHHH